MNLAEFERAKTLLSAEQLAQLDEIQIGRWAVYNDDGVSGVYTRKTEAIDETLHKHFQGKENSKVYRNGHGSYLMCILDPEENPSLQIYLTYQLTRITEKNLFRYQVQAISSMLPNWYFNPYSKEYKSWNQK